MNNFSKKCFLWKECTKSRNKNNKWNLKNINNKSKRMPSQKNNWLRNAIDRKFRDQKDKDNTIQNNNKNQSKKEGKKKKIKNKL